MHWLRESCREDIAAQFDQRASRQVMCNHLSRILTFVIMIAIVTKIAAAGWVSRPISLDSEPSLASLIVRNLRDIREYSC
jgi:hypothetical protein